MTYTATSNGSSQFNIYNDRKCIVAHGSRNLATGEAFASLATGNSSIVHITGCPAALSDDQCRKIMEALHAA